MKIYKEIEILGLGLKYKENLIIGDLQLGYEDYLNRKGVLVPRFQAEDVLKRIKELLSCNDVKRIIFNGDVKHEFGRISSQEWSAITNLIEYLVDKYEVVMIKGNHDVLIEPVIKKYGIKLVDYYSVDDIFITHGDKIFPDAGKIIIIAHEHPAVSFKERFGEKFKCFLLGKWKGHVLIVMPSFSTLTEGSDVTKEKRLSPYLKEDIFDFEVFIVEDGVYDFGKLKNIN